MNNRYGNRLRLSGRVQLIRFSSLVSKPSAIQTYQDYVNHCVANNLNLESMVFKGTLYELYCKHVLEEVFFGYNLYRNGGAYDNGVDIFGKWQLSQFNTTTSTKSKLPTTNCLMTNPKINLTNDINVFIQCKNHDKKMTAKVIRELSGIYNFYIKQDKISIMKNFMFLMSPHVLSKQALTQLDTTTFPLLHVQLAPLESKDGQYSHLKKGQLNPIYLNPTARKILSGFNIELQLESLRRQYNTTINIE